MLQTALKKLDANDTGLISIQKEFILNLDTSKSYLVLGRECEQIQNDISDYVRSNNVITRVDLAVQISKDYFIFFYLGLGNRF